MRYLKFFIVLISFQVMAQTDFEKGEKLFREEQWQQSKIVFESCLKQTPNDYKIIEYLGDIAGHQKKWDEALTNYKILKNRFPKTANYWYKFGGALGMKAKSVSKLKALGMIDEVENAFLTATKLDPKHIEARWALVVLYTELPGIVGGSEKKAKKYSDELMALSKVDGFLSKGYINEYFERYSKAEEDYLQAHEIGNSKTTFQKLYNFYLNKLKDPAKANKLKVAFDKKNV